MVTAGTTLVRLAGKRIDVFTGVNSVALVVFEVAVVTET